MKPYLFVLLTIWFVHAEHHPRAKALWDSVKTLAKPEVSATLQADFGTPFKQPLADYGWEDGLHISRNGLHLYALYTPSDLLSNTLLFATNASLPFCKRFGSMATLRPYAGFYAMDMATNPFGCDSFMNIDIVVSHRQTVTDSFKTWQLSGVANAGAIEGGPTPLFSRTAVDSVDLFLFTSGAGDIWMIRNISSALGSMGRAVRLAPPINPATNEFTADNPFAERTGTSDSLVLIYEKYTNGEQRTFMIALSSDNGLNWDPPFPVTTFTHALGHIEHPHLYHDKSGQWWLYCSINYDIYRSRQIVPGNWDSWDVPELVIAKGNALSLGEPSLTADGSISFLAAYENRANNDSTDRYDLDPWFLPHRPDTRTEETAPAKPAMQSLVVYSGSFTQGVTLRHLSPSGKPGTLGVFNLTGRCVWQKPVTAQGETFLSKTDVTKGMYLVRYHSNGHDISMPLFLIH